jgi:hypothetical protein
VSLPTDKLRNETSYVSNERITYRYQRISIRNKISCIGNEETSLVKITTLFITAASMFLLIVAKAPKVKTNSALAFGITHLRKYLKPNYELTIFN